MNNRLLNTQNKYLNLKAENQALKAELENLNFVLESLSEALLIGNDPSKIFERILVKPQLCILLNPNLTYKQIAQIVDVLDVVPVDHENEQRLAVILTTHRIDPEKESEVIGLIEE